MEECEAELKQSSTTESLVEKIANGQKWAEEMLVSRFWRGLNFILNQRAHNPDLADDLTQDTFIIVIEKIRNGQIENPAKLASFIRNVGVKLLLAHYRKEKRRATDQNPDIDISIPDHHPGLLRLLHSKKLYRSVIQLIDNMTVARDRELMKRYFVYQEDKKLICKALELSPEHFDRVLYRARARLLELIKLRHGCDLLINSPDE